MAKKRARKKSASEVRAIIIAEAVKGGSEADRYHYNNNDFWLRVFKQAFGRTPLSNTDPRWDELLHKKGCAGLDVITAYKSDLSAEKKRAS